MLNVNHSTYPTLPYCSNGKTHQHHPSPFHHQWNEDLRFFFLPFFGLPCTSCFPGPSPSSSLGGSSRKTGDSGESGTEEGQVVEERDTRLPLLLSPFRRTSQWSDMEELVEPTEGEREVSVTMGTGPERHQHMSVPFQSIQKTQKNYSDNSYILYSI